MNRAVAIAASLAVPALAAFIFGIGHRPSDSEPGVGDAERAREISPLESASLTSEPNEPTGSPRTGSGGSLDESAARSAMRSRYTDAEDARDRITREVEESYSLLLKHLGLSSREQDAVRALLIEMQIAAVRAGYEGGPTLDEQERSSKLADVIGDTKVQQFLALERDIAKYWEAATIGSVLGRDGVPLTDTQRDGLVKMLVDFRDYSTAPPSDLDRDSIEFVEFEVAQRNEYERHVVELAPSVLSSRQVTSLFELYQYQSEWRAAEIERQKQLRIQNPTLGLPLFVPAWKER